VAIRRSAGRLLQVDILLLGILGADDGTGPGLSRLGLTEAQAEQALADEFARIRARRVSG
jgi:hypothetical protein